MYYIHSSRFNIDLYRSDVNVIWDLAPHDISIMNYLLRSIPTSVTAWGASGGHVEIVAYVRLNYGRIGVTGYIHVSWLDPKKMRQVTVVGRNKVAAYNDMATKERLRIIDRERGDTRIEGRQKSGWPPSYRYGAASRRRSTSKSHSPSRTSTSWIAFATMTAPETDGFNGLAVVATLEAVERSLRSGGPVELELPTDPAVADARGSAPCGIVGAQ